MEHFIFTGRGRNGNWAPKGFQLVEYDFLFFSLRQRILSPLDT